MQPALRGSNGNPGRNECLFDVVIAAARFLRERPDVDPTGVYLGGHSTGGTLALLAAESTDLFRLSPRLAPYPGREQSAAPPRLARRAHIARWLGAPGGAADSGFTARRR
jgi:dienelactone hydrolase